MKRITTIIAMTACAAVLMSSCQKTPAEKKEGVPMTIQASVVAPTGTKTLYEYDTESKTLEGFWNSEEAITVVSFDQNGITAVDKFTSDGVEGRQKAEFSGTWTGNAGDKVICLYPSVDTYAGNSIFDAVRVGSPTIYMRNLSTALSPLQHNDTGSVSEVDLMLGEVRFGVEDEDEDDYEDDYDEDYYYSYTKANGNEPHVYLEHLIAVFRIEVTVQNLTYDATPASPYDQAKINTIRIKCVDPNSEEEEEWGPYGDPVFVRVAGMDVTTDSYTGKPFAIERGPLDYYLVDSGNYSDLYSIDGKVVKKTFFVPVRFSKDLEEGYELCFQFGGNYYFEDKKNNKYGRESIAVFPIGDKRKTILHKLPLENGKVYGFKVTI